jgi:Fe2+ transport system protein FeoA
MWHPFRHRHHRKRAQKCQGPTSVRACPHRPEQLTLADVPPGCQVRITGFCAGLPAERRAHLAAYGMNPGYQAQVLQNSPVTVIRIEHVELAMEVELACEILVETPIQDNMN